MSKTLTFLSDFQYGTHENDVCSGDDAELRAAGQSDLTLKSDWIASSLAADEAMTMNEGRHREPEGRGDSVTY
jgi:hypothetical protein